MSNAPNCDLEESRTPTFHIDNVTLCQLSYETIVVHRLRIELSWPRRGHQFYRLARIHSGLAMLEAGLSRLSRVLQVCVSCLRWVPPAGFEPASRGLKGRSSTQVELRRRSAVARGS